MALRVRRLARFGNARAVLALRVLTAVALRDFQNGARRKRRGRSCKTTSELKRKREEAHN